jgi:hypothetical protein
METYMTPMGPGSGIEGYAKNEGKLINRNEINNNIGKAPSYNKLNEEAQ